jgi:ketol-acid reductoisomerase
MPLLWPLSFYKCSFKRQALPGNLGIVMKNQNAVVIVGFGSQARAWAFNLRDSKVPLKIALQKNSASLTKAKSLGFECIELENSNLKNYRQFVVLIPDDKHLGFFQKNATHFEKGSHFIYAHGFSLSKERLHEKYSDFAHSLLAPKAIASEVRFQFESKGKIGAAFYAQDTARENELKELAGNVGFTALYKSHFEEECMADLFSEQSLLCSLIPYGALKSYNLLRKNGISAEVAFMECYLELKSISGAFVTLGPEAFFNLISPNALIGSQKGRHLLMGEAFDKALEQILIDIKNKEFYKEVETDADALRQKVLAEWKSEELSKTFEKLKPELIV